MTKVGCVSRTGDLIEVRMCVTTHPTKLVLMVCLIISLLSAETSAQQHLTTPFSKHEERYQPVFTALIQKGITPEKINRIFSSEKARQIDKTAIERAYKRATGLASLKSKQQLSSISTRLLNHIRKHRKIYQLLEEKYSVNKEIVAAILFKETDLGEFNNWQNDSFVVLNSLLSFLEIPKNSPPRQQKRLKRIIRTAQQSLVGLLTYCELHNIDIVNKEFPSSFAGAVGLPQFMPMYLDYVVDENNHSGNLNKTSDAILSAGNLLKNKFAWPGLLDFNQLQSIDQLFQQYVEFDKITNDASFCMSTDLDDYPLQSFLDKNHAIASHCESLMNYNFSSNYVLDVLQLAFHTKKIEFR